MELSMVVSIKNLNELNDHLNKAQVLSELLQNEIKQIDEWKPDVEAKLNETN